LEKSTISIDEESANSLSKSCRYLSEKTAELQHEAPSRSGATGSYGSKMLLAFIVMTLATKNYQKNELENLEKSKEPFEILLSNT